MEVTLKAEIQALVAKRKALRKARNRRYYLKRKAQIEHSRQSEQQNGELPSL